MLFLLGGKSRRRVVQSRLTSSLTKLDADLENVDAELKQVVAEATFTQKNVKHVKLTYDVRVMFAFRDNN